MPVFKIPVHMTYLHFIGQFSAALAKCYFRLAIGMCRLTGVAPSFLLHPLDFLGIEDEPDLAFFPGMRLAREKKLKLVHDALAALSSRYELSPLIAQARALGVQDTRSRLSFPVSESSDRATCPGERPSLEML